VEKEGDDGGQLGRRRELNGCRMLCKIMTIVHRGTGWESFVYCPFLHAIERQDGMTIFVTFKINGVPG